MTVILFFGIYDVNLEIVQILSAYEKLILLLAVLLLAGGCAENPEVTGDTTPGGTGTLSPEEARVFFETRRAVATRGDGEGAVPDAEPLMPGDVSPLWDRAS